MSEDPSVDAGAPRAVRGRSAGNLVGVLGAALPDVALSKASQCPFTIDSKSAWLMVGDDFLPPPGGRPGPITFDKRYPYVDNAAARRTGTQPTYRVAEP